MKLYVSEDDLKDYFSQTGNVWASQSIMGMGWIADFYK
jgi:hypothetical protein